MVGVEELGWNIIILGVVGPVVSAEVAIAIVGLVGSCGMNCIVGSVVSKVGILAVLLLMEIGSSIVVSAVM